MAGTAKRDPVVVSETNAIPVTRTGVRIPAAGLLNPLANKISY